MDARTWPLKAEHAVDLETEAIVAAQVTHADRGDAQTGPDTIIMAQAHLLKSGRDAEIQEVVEDKGYHDNALLAWHAQWGVRTYIPERKQKTRTWADKPEAYEAAFRANRRRVQSDKGRRLNRWRSERCERTFAHVCETGGGRRMWLRGVINASKSHLMRCCAYNLGLLLRKCCGLAKPRSGAAAWALLLAAGALMMAMVIGTPTETADLLAITITAIALIHWSLFPRTQNVQLTSPA
jgi:transposase